MKHTLTRLLGRISFAFHWTWVELGNLFRSKDNRSTVVLLDLPDWIIQRIKSEATDRKVSCDVVVNDLLREYIAQATISAKKEQAQGRNKRQSLTKK